MATYGTDGMKNLVELDNVGKGYSGVFVGFMPTPNHVLVSSESSYTLPSLDLHKDNFVQLRLTVEWATTTYVYVPNTGSYEYVHYPSSWISDTNSMYLEFLNGASFFYIVDSDWMTPKQNGEILNVYNGSSTAHVYLMNVFYRRIA